MSVILSQTRKLEDVSPDGALWTCPQTGGPDHPPPQLSNCTVTNRRRTLRTCSDTSLPSPLRTSQDAGHSATAAPQMSAASLWPVLRGDKGDAWLCPAPSRIRSSLREGRLQRPGRSGAIGAFNDHPLGEQAADHDASPVINATRDQSRSLGELIKSGSEQGSQRRGPAEQLRGGVSPWQQEDL